MLQRIRQFFQLVIAKIQAHKAGNKSELWYKSIPQKVEWHIEILQALESSFFKINLFNLIVCDIDLLNSR